MGGRRGHTRRGVSNVVPAPSTARWSWAVTSRTFRWFMGTFPASSSSTTRLAPTAATRVRPPTQDPPPYPPSPKPAPLPLPPALHAPFCAPQITPSPSSRGSATPATRRCSTCCPCWMHSGGLDGGSWGGGGRKWGCGAPIGMGGILEGSWMPGLVGGGSQQNFGIHVGLTVPPIAPYSPHRFTADVRSVLSRNLHQHRLW